MQQNQNGNRRLDSWKEIAAHLGRNERTAIRWEKKGLPVHRVPGGQRQSVFAYTTEIDAWLVSQDGKAAASNSFAEQGAQSNENPAEILTGGPTTGSAGHTPTVTKLSNKTWGVVAGAIFALALVATVTVLLARSHPTTAIRPSRFTQLTDDGKFKINFRTDGATLYFTEKEGARSILVSRPIGGGAARQIATPFANVTLEGISNDGQRLLVTAFQGMESERPLWVISARDGTASRVGDVLCELARWSPDNRRIACAAGTSIVVLGSDGSGARTLASFPSIPINLLWSLDGQRLRFVLRDTTSNSFSPWELTIGKENGSETPISSKRLDWKDVCWDWAWTRNGESFACLKRDSNGKSSVWLTPNGRISNRPAVELPLGIQTVIGLAPGKMDNALYLLANSSNHDELLKLDSKKKTFETYLQGLSADSLAFSRDGQWMTYTSIPDNTLWRRRVDGSNALQLTKSPFEVELSAWSPDGTQIAFMARHTGKPWRIYLVSRDGGTPIEAASGNDNQGAPTWSPDGKFLVYANVDCNESQTCWVRRLDLTTGQAQAIPGSHGFRTARWSPDGKYIAALQPQTHELMLFDIKKHSWRVLADSISGDNINWSSDSRFVYADSPTGENPIIERIRIPDAKRVTVADLASLRNAFGQISTWSGLAPDNSPIVVRAFVSSEVYELDWTDH